MQPVGPVRTLGMQAGLRTRPVRKPQVALPGAGR